MDQMILYLYLSRRVVLNASRRVPLLPFADAPRFDLTGFLVFHAH